MSFFTALSFLTIIPSPFRGEGGAGEIGRSLKFFPAVGLVIGLILAGLYWLLGLLLPAAVVYGILLAAMVIITGGLHLDGLADTCDGIPGHKTAEERLEIMRDSRVGAFGVIGVVLLLLIKYVSLVSIPGNLLAAALLMTPVLGRWAMVYAVIAFPYARPSGLGAAFKPGAGWPTFTFATIIMVAATLGLTRLADIAYFYVAAAAIIISVWAMTLGLAFWLKRKLGGLTGDNYGAVCEAAEVLVLIIISMLAQKQWFGVSG